MFTLRQSLQLDAIASGAMGVGLAALASPAEKHLGLPVGLSIGVGIFLLVWAGFVGWAASRDSRALGREIALLNVGWIALSVVALSVLDLTGVGVAFVIVQAAAVAVFAELQWLGARAEARRTPVPA